jgi:UDP-2,3-diacylglucosamine pyrophosphatase LpxH
MTNGKPEQQEVGLDRKSFEGIRRGLDAAFKRATRLQLDPAAERIVVFSDHHKGAGDPADDFRRCEHAYTAALGFYLEAGYRLFVLGDAEELWEEHPEPVIKRYDYVLKLEAEFASRGNGFERFYGNHDDQWSSKRQVRKHLRDVFGEINVREALRLEVSGPDAASGTLFFVHGHQGTPDSDRWRFFARLVVRHFWRPIQRRLGYSATTPARNWELRAKHDRAMYEWARTQRPGLVMVAGHTHRPVFARCIPDPPPTRPLAELERLLDEAKAGGDKAAAAAIRAELEYARTSDRRPETALQVVPPCYFNTGCCSFPDGDITGLEIAEGELRLVRWAGNIREMHGADGGGGVDAGRRIIATEDLAGVFAAVAGPAPDDQRVVEREIRPE